MIIDQLTKELDKIENELKKRLVYPYVWGRMQGNYYDNQTRFIYKITNIDELLNVIKSEFDQKRDGEYKSFFNYSLNRWYNFWSANAVEKIFCSIEGVEAHQNQYSKLVDFTINGINFDHKTSVFPKGYPGDLEQAVNNKRDLIQWLYDNQSQQQRKHLKNRLFIVLFSRDDEHWKLKAEIKWIKNFVVKYVKNFNINNLEQFTFEDDNITYSDIIWAIK